MVRKKIDNRIRVLIENGVSLGHRSFFAVVGDKAKDQVVILHHMLSKAQVKARPSVLWCYKKELGFSTHRKKRMRQIQRKVKTGDDDQDEDPFEMFISSTTIRWCYYNETHRILGNTYGMLVLQDFEAITPNLLARTIETVEGGGIVVVLLNTLKSLKQLYTMTMDVHSRFRTEAHHDVVPRFNERFMLSLASCAKCLVIDDKLNVLPISSHAAAIQPVPKPDSSTPISPEAQKLQELNESLADTQPLGSLINCCRTFDQGKALLKFIDSISEKTLRSTVSLTAARGRGKSAALGLAIAGAIAFNYSNIYVTSPSPENLKTLFEFILKGFDAIHLQEHLDYEIIQSTNADLNKAIIRINVFREHRQTIQYIHPTDAGKTKLLSQSAELVVIDEAAAIPLPVVKSLLGPYLVFMSSTINGYEGTGRSLSLKLLAQLRQQSSTFGGRDSKSSEANAFNRVLHEVTLDESIRYKNNDDVEKWLYQVLCLDVALAQDSPSCGCPDPEECSLYYINRDTLFSFHKASEAFLHRLMSLYVSSHYKNSPNDLQMMSDAPAHHLFCLLPPMSDEAKAKGRLPEVLCFLQICLEGQISKDSVMSSLSRGRRAAGDLIPWTISQQFQDPEFATLSGARVIRIATNTNFQGMGYGSRTLKLVEDYFKGKFNVNLSEGAMETNSPNECEELDSDSAGGNLEPRKKLEPLLMKLDERRAEQLDYIGVSYGLTSQLFKFWQKSGYTPMYLRQTQNELTGEHSCIMLKRLTDEDDEKGVENGERTPEKDWLVDFWVDFRRRFVSLLSYQFRELKASLGLQILQQRHLKIAPGKIQFLDKEELGFSMTLYDLKRLELYAQNLVDYHLIVDLLPAIATYFFVDKFHPPIHLSAGQSAILLAIGLQRRTVDEVAEELGLQGSQVLGLFVRAIKKIASVLRAIKENELEDSICLRKMTSADGANLTPLTISLRDEMMEAAAGEKRTQDRQVKRLVGESKDLEQYAVKGNDDDWDKVLKGKERSLVTIKSIQTKDHEEIVADNSIKKKQNFKQGKRKKMKK